MLARIRSAAETAGIHDNIRESFKAYAADITWRRKCRSGYLHELQRIYRFYVEAGASILEIGVGSGDLLASLPAGEAVGVDLSEEMLEIAKTSHPQLKLYHAAAEDLRIVQGQFDYIILSDLSVHLLDILNFLKTLPRLCHPRTRIIFNFHSRLWQPLLQLLSWAGLHHEAYRTNWVTIEDLTNLLNLAGFEILTIDKSTILPVYAPPLSTIVNRWLARLPLVKELCLVNWVIARPEFSLGKKDQLSVSVICACKNEEGNIRQIVERIPQMGRVTELIFVEGGSTDGTWNAVRQQLRKNSRPDVALRAYQQQGMGKADAVQFGFSVATGDVLMILDADLTVPPEELPTFLEVLAEGKGEFINGSRLVYPMDSRAMRFLNLLANKFFALLFSYILDQTIKDTLCGTKVMSRGDYERIDKGRLYFGQLDPFGDFDLLFGAAKLHLRIVEIPVRYRERVYGETNISRFRHGWRLFRMSILGLKRLKFF